MWLDVGNTAFAFARLVLASHLPWHITVPKCRPWIHASGWMRVASYCHFGLTRWRVHPWPWVGDGGGALLLADMNIARFQSWLMPVFRLASLACR